MLLATEPRLLAMVTRSSAERLGLGPGVAVYASFKAAGVVVLPG